MNFAVINVYCPRVDPEKPERRTFKIRFYEMVRQRAAAIRATGSHVVILGDINTSHKQIDHCDPDETEVIIVSCFLCSSSFYAFHTCNSFIILFTCWWIYGKCEMMYHSCYVI